MWKPTSLGLMLFLVTPGFPQSVSPVAAGPRAGVRQMVVPPPASIEPFQTGVLADKRSNYLRGGISFGTTYIDNLYAGNNRPPIGETMYSIWPTLHLDQTTSTRHAAIAYRPGFVFYRPTGALDEVDQNAYLSYQVRLSPHSGFSLNDNVQYYSTPFYSPAQGLGGAVVGSTQTVTPGFVVPYAKRLNNAANGEFTMQTGRASLFGVTGSATTLHFPDASQATGVYDSNSHSATGFFSGRFGSRQYYGFLYQYGNTHAYLTSAESDNQVQSVLVFYTIYPKEHLSLSVTGGPQHYRFTQAPLLAESSWDTSLTATIGWQGRFTSLAAGYSQAITGGGGLIGAYRSRSTSADASWMFTRAWTASVNATYVNNTNVTPLALGAFPGGNSIFGTCMVQRPVGRQLTFSFAYSHLHQNYAGIQAISSNPNSNAVGAKISWQFMRPLGQ